MGYTHKITKKSHIPKNKYKKAEADANCTYLQ